MNVITIDDSVPSMICYCNKIGMLNLHSDAEKHNEEV